MVLVCSPECRHGPGGTRCAHQNAGMGLVVVGGVHAVEPLLTSCVPEVCEHGGVETL